MFRLPYVRSRELPPSQFLVPAALLPRSPIPMRPAIELPPTGHDDDAFGEPGGRLWDGGVSHALLPPELLLCVAVVDRSADEACVDAEEDDADADGFDASAGDVACLPGDWLPGQERRPRDRNRGGTGQGVA